MDENTILSLVSVIIPVYNVEKGLKKTVKSVVNQRYKNLEIILINDGSSDSSGIVCEELKKTDARISVIHKPKGSLSSAKNIGLERATGDYIVFVSSNDWIDTDMIKSLYKSLIRWQAEIAICGYYFTDGKDWSKAEWYMESCCMDKTEGIAELIEDKKMKNYVWNKLYKAELFDDIRFPENKLYEDTYIMHRIFQNCSKVSIVNNYGYYYHKKNSITADKSISNGLKSLEAQVVRYKELMESYPQFEYDMLREILVNSVSVLSLNKITKLDHVYYKNELKEIKNFIRSKIIVKKVFYMLTNKQKIIYLFTRLCGERVSCFYRSQLINYFFHITIKILAKLKSSIISKSESLNIKVSRKKSIFIIGTPEYGNLGDQAIAFAEIQFLNKYFKDYDIIEVTENVYKHNVGHIKRLIKNNDIIILQGGGNMGNVYLEQEKIRLSVITNFSKQKIIIFPQTIHIEQLNNKIKKYKGAVQYAKNKNLIIVAREISSYNMMKSIFKNKVVLIPDIVMSLKAQNAHTKREGCILCLRDDREKDLEVDCLYEIKKICAKLEEDISFTDTYIHAEINKSERKKVLDSIWKKFSSSKLIITDRLHGMIFAALTETPCVVLGNYNHKNKNSYKWLSNLEYIVFCENINSLQSNIEHVMKIKNCIYDNTKLEKYFNDLAGLII